MLKFYESRTQIFTRCSGDAEDYIKPIYEASDVFYYFNDRIVNIKIADCGNAVIADFANQHETAPNLFSEVVVGYDADGKIYSYVREGALFTALELACNTCFYYIVTLADDSVWYSDTCIIACCCEGVHIESTYPKYDFLGRYYGAPCSPIVRYPADAVFSNRTLICGSLKLSGFDNAINKRDERDCRAQSATTSKSYNLSGHAGIAPYEAENVNTIFSGNGLIVEHGNEQYALSPKSTEWFSSTPECVCLFYINAALTSCPSEAPLYCTNTTQCCLTISVPNGGQTDIAFDFNNQHVALSCIKDGRIICDVDGVPFGGSLQPTNIVLSNPYATYSYECSGETCCVTLTISRSEAYSGAGIVAYSFLVNGVPYNGTFTVVENGNFVVLRMCFEAGASVSLVSVTADGTTTLYPGSGTQIQASIIDPITERAIFSALLDNGCGECSCVESIIFDYNPTPPLYIWFASQTPSNSLPANTIFFLAQNPLDMGLFSHWLNQCSGDYIYAYNGTTLIPIKKAALVILGNLPTANIPALIGNAGATWPTGFDYAYRYSYIDDAIYPTCPESAQAHAQTMSNYFAAAPLAFNVLQLPISSAKCVKLVDDCGTYPPPCTLSITNVQQICQGGYIDIVVSFSAPSMTGDLHVTAVEAAPPNNSLIVPYDTPAAVGSTGFSIPSSTVGNIIITLTSVINGACIASTVVNILPCNDCTTCLADSVFAETITTSPTGAGCTGTIVMEYKDPAGTCDWVLCQVIRLLSISTSYEVWPINNDPVCTAIIVIPTGIGTYEMQNAPAGDYWCIWRLGSCANTICQNDNTVTLAPIALRRCVFFAPDSYDFMASLISVTGGMTFTFTSIKVNGVEYVTGTPPSIFTPDIATFAANAVPTQAGHYPAWIGFCTLFNSLSIPNVRFLYSINERIGYNGDPFRIEYPQGAHVEITAEVHNGSNVLHGVYNFDTITGTLFNGALLSPPARCENSDPAGIFPCETEAGIFVECAQVLVGGVFTTLIKVGYDGAPLQQGEAVVRQYRINSGAWITPTFPILFNGTYLVAEIYFDTSDLSMFVSGMNTINVAIQHAPNGLGCSNIIAQKTITFNNLAPSVCASLIVT